MSNHVWGRPSGREARTFAEKAYGRQSLPAWDARWHALSIQARFFFLNEVKGPVQKRVIYSRQPSVSVEKFPPHVLEELTAAGFVEVKVATSGASTDRVVALDGLHDFAARLRALRRFHLLAADRVGEFEKYVASNFHGGELVAVIAGVLHRAGIDDHPRIEEALARYVTRHHWPGWVARALKDPMADRILDLLHEARGPVPLAELAGRLGKGDPPEVRLALDKLVTYLAVVEDLQPDTWELMVGLLPAVREEILLASQPRERPELVVVERPVEIGPDDGVLVNDIRTVLLEVVSEPPRLRQDLSLFHKETERFQATLEPLAAWMREFLHWSEEGRLNRALNWARALGLVEEVSDGSRLRLHLAPKGHEWLSGGLDEQYAAVFRLLTAPARRGELYEPHMKHFFAGIDPYNNVGPRDMRYLGEQVLVIKVAKKQRTPYYWDEKPEDHEALRNALDQAWTMLKPGLFHRLDSVVSHLVFGEHNPLHLGLAPDQVAVFWGTRPVPALEEQREEAARLLLDAFLRRRLIPLGCVRVAIDGDGRIAVARLPRCDAYFGRKVGPSDLAPAATAAARVVVQPDFSVIVIGTNPAAAELVPFCERTTRGGGQGATVLRITRGSVVKAVGQGLKPEEIAARLQRHASNEVPANVLREVLGWSRWVRQVTPSTLIVLRCPDRDTADRVMGALKRQAERINDTLVAINQKKLTAAERTKLQSHGIIIQGHSEPREDSPRARRKR